MTISTLDMFCQYHRSAKFNTLGVILLHYYFHVYSENFLLSYFTLPLSEIFDFNALLGQTSIWPFPKLFSFISVRFLVR